MQAQKIRKVKAAEGLGTTLRMKWCIGAWHEMDDFLPFAFLVSII